MDINVDMGESFGNWVAGEDAELIPLISSANIACGFHAGDPTTMVRTAQLAVHHDVAAGAHPGLPDLLGFGRRRMEITPEEAASYVLAQAAALEGVLRWCGGRLHHIKPHGALVGLLREDDRLADAVAEMIGRAFPEVLLYFPAPTESAALCRAATARGVRVIGELYPDLHYRADGEVLIERQKLRTDVDFAVAQVGRFMDAGEVEATDGSRVEIDASSICIHGDGPNAVEVAAAIRAEVLRRGGEIAAPCQSGPTA